MGEDPVKEGLVPSLSRPGANVTGVSDFANQLAGKRLNLLRDTVPKAAVYALLVRPSNPNAEPDTNDAMAAARVLGLDLRFIISLKTARAIGLDIPPGVLAIADEVIE